MLTIHKYPIEPLDTFNLYLHKGADILCVQAQHGQPHIWATVDPDAKLMVVKFRVFGTGHTLPDYPLKYVGTWQEHMGELVWHLYIEAMDGETLG